MPKFFYIVRDKQGRKKSGVEEASSQEEVIKKLQAQNLIVINILPEQKERLSEAERITTKARLKAKHNKITGSDLVLFCRQLATLLGAGVTILKSLEIISKQVSSRRLYIVIEDLRRKMEEGFSFHEAMQKHKHVFSDLWINLVESGEASGSLALVLARLSGYLEKNAEFRRKITSASIYPVILTAVAIIALLFMTIAIIPRFAEIFSSFDVTLPLITQILIAFSNFARRFKFIIILLAVVSVMIFRWYINTSQGRRKYENFLFSLPVLGDFFRIMIYERFTSEMATLIESGVPILYSLEIAERSVSNKTAGEIISRIKDEVRDGKPLNLPLDKSGFFDPMAVQMIAVGEEIGELSVMFKRLNTFYQEQIDTFLTRFTAVFEPFMLIFLGVMIGFMVIGLFMPIFRIAKLAG